MAKTLNKIGITTGNTVEAYHVTQSVDAFTAIDAYDISLSGSFNMTGSINGEPTVINPLTASYAITASYALNALSASYAVSSSHEIIKEVSSSHANFADTASYVETAQTASFVSLAAGPNITINQSGTTFEISGSGGGGGITPSETGSFYISSSINANTITFNQGDGTTESVTIDTGATTWYTASSTAFNVPQGNSVGVYINYDGGAQVTLDLPDGANIGDSVEIITQNSADGKITVDYDTGQIRAWSTGSATSGSISQASAGQHPTMKLVYIGVHSITSIKTWNLVRYVDESIATAGGGTFIYDTLVFQST